MVRGGRRPAVPAHPPQALLPARRPAGLGGGAAHDPAALAPPRRRGRRDGEVMHAQLEGLRRSGCSQRTLPALEGGRAQRRHQPNHGLAPAACRRLPAALRDLARTGRLSRGGGGGVAEVARAPGCRVCRASSASRRHRDPGPAAVVLESARRATSCGSRPSCLGAPSRAETAACEGATACNARSDATRSVAASRQMRRSPWGTREPTRA